MNNLLHLPAPNYFGDCPECRHNDGHLNIRDEHWFICKRHQVKWRAGSGIFPDWHTETEMDWKVNALLLDHYKEITPLQQWKSPGGSTSQPEPCLRRAKIVRLKISNG